MERLADGARGFEEFLDVALNLFTKACLVEVETEDVLAAEEFFQRARYRARWFVLCVKGGLYH